MTNDTLKIKVPAPTSRPATYASWMSFYSQVEIVEILNRYCDIKDRETKYRRGAAAKAKAVRAYLVAAGLDPNNLPATQVVDEPADDELADGAGA